MTSTEREKKFHIWDSYWNTERVYSFGVELFSDAAVTLDRHWTGLMARLFDGATVLDVACGNGAAALALKRASIASGGTLAITAVDEAAIDPPQYLPAYAADLSRIEFRPRVAMEKLPFEDASFDAVVSQFGFEFGNPSLAIAEAARVLKPGGFVSVLALPAQSTAVQSAKKSLKQARYLLHDADLFDETLKIIQGYYDGPAETREQKMRTDLEGFNKQVEAAVNLFDESEFAVVAVIVTCLNDIFIDRKNKSASELMMVIQTARTKLAHHAARSQATVKSAVDGKMEGLRAALMKAEFKLTESRSLFVQGQGIVAYQLTAERA